MASIAVLLLAYGTPETLDQVADYFAHIRGGRTPSPEAVEMLRDRYQQVGGRTPLLEITKRIAHELQESLDHHSPGIYRTYVGMKHWHPYIADVIPRIAADGIRRIVAIVLAPHCSRLGRGDYRDYLEAAIGRVGEPIELTLIESWHDQPELVALWASRVREALAALAPEPVSVVFTAHSLPARIRSANARYEAELLASCRAVAEAVGLAEWRFAWQSAGSTGEPWFDPTLSTTLDRLAAEGGRQVLVVPIGFICDHLEVLYDLDHEAAAQAAGLGLTLRRPRMPNSAPELVAALEALVRAGERSPATAPEIRR